MATKKSKVSSIDVKVNRSGSKVNEYTLNGNRTVEEALRIAGLRRKESEIVQVNGEEIEDMDYNLEDGDRVVLIKNIEAGHE